MNKNMVKFSFSYKGKKYNLDVKECKSIFSKMSGLMFRKNSKPLLFIFEKPVKEPIHSFFCVPFVAIWLDGNKIVDVKHVLPWKTSVKPSERFDKLLEIPSNNENFEKLCLLIK